MTELEVRTEFQGQSLSDLDEVVREFTHRVERLEQQFAELRQQLASLGGDPPPDVGD